MCILRANFSRQLGLFKGLRGVGLRFSGKPGPVKRRMERFVGGGWDAGAVVKKSRRGR